MVDDRHRESGPKTSMLQNNNGAVAAQSDDDLDSLLHQVVQAASGEEKTPVPGPYDGSSAYRATLAPFEDGREVAGKSEKGPSSSEGQRDPFGRAPQSSRQSALLQHRSQNRECRRLGLHKEKVSHTYGQRAREGGRKGR